MFRTVFPKLFHQLDFQTGLKGNKLTIYPKYTKNLVLGLWKLYLYSLPTPKYTFWTHFTFLNPPPQPIFLYKTLLLKILNYFLKLHSNILWAIKTYIFMWIEKGHQVQNLSLTTIYYNFRFCKKCVVGKFRFKSVNQNIFCLV